MSTVSVEQFLPFVQPYIIGAPKYVLLNEIMGSIIEFCDETGVVQEVLDPVTVQGGTSEFDLDAPPGTRICMVNALWDAELGMAITRDDFSLVGGDMIRLSSPLPMDVNLAADVATKPKRSSGRCETLLYEDWIDGIIAGSLFRLQSMVGREWADPKSALFNEQMYRRSITKAKHAARARRVNKIGRIHIEQSYADFS